MADKIAKGKVAINKKWKTPGIKPNLKNSNILILNLIETFMFI